MIASCSAGFDSFVRNAWTPILCLAWFLLGLLLGRRLSARRGAPGSRPSGGSPVAGGKGTVELYVGNLPYEMSEKDLQTTFERFGRVASVRIITKKTDGQSRGYGFVQMADRAEAEAAVKAMHGNSVGGRDMVVNEARSRGQNHR